MSMRELGVTGDAPYINQEGDRGPIPQQLNEVIELVSSVNQRIEDCAVEWQAKISQAQWRILDVKPIANKPWEQSVLARTYFADKTLDDAFQGLLHHNKSFTDHLHNFVALVRGDRPTMTTRQTCNAQNQCTESGSREVDKVSAPESPNLGNNGTRKSDCVLTKAQQSFTDLMKAKIDFDSKFLGFEATLNSDGRVASDPVLNLCQICCSVLECGLGKSTKSHQRNVQLYKKKARRSSRIKHKRLATRKMNLAKMRERNPAEKTVGESAPDNSRAIDQSGATTDRL